MFSLRLMPRRLAGALAILAAVAAGSATTALAQQITAETVIATVNGTPITAGELQLAGAEFADQLGQVPADRRDAAVLDLVINMRLASAAATTAHNAPRPENCRIKLLSWKDLSDVRKTTATRRKRCRPIALCATD